MRLLEIFQKQGGMELIRQYAKSGALYTAIAEFILLGKSRTALEILRLSTHLKTKQKLSKKYGYVLRRFENNYNVSLPHKYSNKVWVCWLQGMENAPKIVKKCYESIKENLTDRDIILITNENLEQYVNFPKYIIDKWKAGIITNTHLSDLLRLELLIRYGGLWLDATVFCSDNRENIPDYFFNSELFFYQNLKPGRDGDAYYFASWLINAKSNNKILMAVRALCYEYWKKQNSLYDYFLLHAFFAIVLDFYPKEWQAVIPRDCASPHILSLMMFNQYDENMWKAVKAQTPFHKMTYKFSQQEAKKSNTYYKILFEQNR